MKSVVLSFIFPKVLTDMVGIDEVIKGRRSVRIYKSDDYGSSKDLCIQYRKTEARSCISCKTKGRLLLL